MKTIFLASIDYLDCYKSMQSYTTTRDASTPDVLLICEHPPTYTLGLAGKREHLLCSTEIPVIQTDRGGQITYHGPGQLIAYPLVDLKRKPFFVKEYVFKIEEALIKTLLHFGLTGQRVSGAPGIYVDLQNPKGHAKLKPLIPKQSGSSIADSEVFSGIGKIAALGIKVSKHCTYHGLALNVNMDLTPFESINPCGYSGLRTVDFSSLGVRLQTDEVAPVLAEKLCLYLEP